LTLFEACELGLKKPREASVVSRKWLVNRAGCSAGTLPANAAKMAGLRRAANYRTLHQGAFKLLHKGETNKWHSVQNVELSWRKE
jgi:hypothetical protein